MEDYEIDLPADVVVDWIAEAVKREKSGLLVKAWREYVAGNDLIAETGAYEETSVAETIAVGSLEVVPEHRAHSWVLRVRVEDELGDRIPDDEDVPEGPEEIDLEQFRDEFMDSPRGMPSIWVAALNPSDKEAFDAFLAELERSAGRRVED